MSTRDCRDRYNFSYCDCVMSHGLPLPVWSALVECPSLSSARRCSSGEPGTESQKGAVCWDMDNIKIVRWEKVKVKHFCGQHMLSRKA